MSPVHVLCDASIVVPWYSEADERQVAECKAIAAADRRRAVPWVSDLTHLEIANALIRKAKATQAQMQIVLTRLVLIAGAPMRLSAAHHHDAAGLAVEHGLTVYDASYWALARASGAVLATLDSELLRVGAGVTPEDLCEALGLEVS